MISGWACPRLCGATRSRSSASLIVSIDPDGRNLFEEQKVIYNERKEAVKQAIYPEVNFIK